MNQVTLVGNLGADPELKYLQDGTAVCNLRVCTSEKWTDKAGVQQERSHWHNVVLWGTEAETLARAASKGTRVMIVGGSLETRDYDSREGEKRYVTEVVVRWPRGQIAIVPRSDDTRGAAPAQAGYGQGRPAEQPRGGYGQQPAARRAREA